MIARVGLVAGVSPSMDHELTSAGETLIAVFALIRPLSSMSSLMQPQSFFDGKTLVANVALVRHFARVRAHMDGETADLDELAATDAALVRFVAGVFTGMLLHVVLAGKGLLAIWTRKRFGLFVPFGGLCRCRSILDLLHFGVVVALFS